ncbi:MAG: hypothetical protein Fur0014_12050 [Rubrivivax sp.]
MNEHGHRAYALTPLSGGPRLPARRETCPMCGHPGGGAVACGSCGAPLTPPPRIDDPQEAGRRGSPRVERIEAVLWQPAGGGDALAMTLQDLSFTGMSLDSLLAVPEGQVARVRAPNLDGVVQVVHCRREGGEWRVHARLLTLRLLTRAGALVSTTV